MGSGVASPPSVGAGVSHAMLWGAGSPREPGRIGAPTRKPLGSATISRPAGQGPRQGSATGPSEHRGDVGDCHDDRRHRPDHKCSRSYGPGSLSQNRGPQQQRSESIGWRLCNSRARKPVSATAPSCSRFRTRWLLKPPIDRTEEFLEELR